MRIQLESTTALLLLLLPVTWELAIGSERRYLRHHGRGSRHARSHVSHPGGSKSDRVEDRPNAIPIEPESTKTPARLFVSPNHTVVLAQIGTTATMHCEVNEIGESTITWIRRKDYQLLTVGLTTYSSDDRFFTALGKDSQIDEAAMGSIPIDVANVSISNGGTQVHQHMIRADWTLHLRFATEKDSGLYECQISTHPPTSLFVELQLVEAHADIVGGPDKIVKSGSSLRLTCVLRRSTEPPAYVFWYHGARMINFDLGGGAAVRHGRQSSELLIPKAQKQHAGNYSCVPSNARPASVNVHVLQVEKPAAMQHGSKNSSKSSTHWNLHQYITSTVGTTLVLLICR